MKLLTVIGARPQIIKAAAFSRAIKNLYPDSVKEIILHTGQHYDSNMSDVFIKQLGIPEPDYNLNTGSGQHGETTAKMIAGIEEVLVKEVVDGIVLYGDTNSTLAGAVAASKIHVPIIHIEAGLRSYNKSMPEELNRIMCDHASTLLFSPTPTGIVNLEKEGFDKDAQKPYSVDNPKIYQCGDLMYDNSLYFAKNIENEKGILSKYGVDKGGEFILVTCHRPQNTDSKEALTSIFDALNTISKEDNIKVVLPLHPRTKALMDRNVEEDVLASVRSNENFILGEPANFIEMIGLEKNCSMIISDSGGVQKEAFFFNKPAVIMRPETEWVEIVESGSATLAGSDGEKIKSQYKELRSKDLSYPSIFGDGKAAEFMIKEIVENL